METSQKVLNYMDSVGVSAYKISRATGISESTFSKWRAKPTSKIDMSIVEKIANYLEVSIDELLGKEQKNKLTSKKGSLSETQKELLNLFDLLTPNQQDSLLALARSIAAERRSKGM